MAANASDAVLYPTDDRAYLRRVRIRNYRSIGKCELELAPLTVLVGRNGAGKSNILDALRFVVDGLQTSLDHALKSRAGLDSVRRRSTGHPRNFAVEFDLELPGFRAARYGFEVAARSQGAFVVRQERLQVEPEPGAGPPRSGYDVREGTIESATRDNMPPVAADRLYLVTAASLPEFRPVYDALLSMGFYNLAPDRMKELQSPDAGEILHRDGNNLPSVIARLRAQPAGAFDRVLQYLQAIVPGIVDVDRLALGPRETLEFRQGVRGAERPWRFYAANMSDGTLRALGALVAVRQVAGRGAPVMLIGIEEPETALHPAASGALVDALREATSHTQVIVTSHSPDLLDHLRIPQDALYIVRATEGTTEVAPPDPASMQAIREELYQPGDLLRMDQLEPDSDNLRKQAQLKLFDGDEDAE